MKLKKEDVYIDLRGKSEEELTDLYNFLESVGEEQYRKDLISFLEHSKVYETYNFRDSWTLGWYVNSKNKTEVTIEQLKEILQPMENKEYLLITEDVEYHNKMLLSKNSNLPLTEQLHKAEAEVKRLQSLIEEENTPKIGDWCKFWNVDKSNMCIGKLRCIWHADEYKYHTSASEYKNCEKITNAELIKLLEDESK